MFWQKRKKRNPLREEIKKPLEYSLIKKKPFFLNVSFISFLKRSTFVSGSQLFKESMFASMMRQGWHMLQALKCTKDLFLEKDFYYSISFGNVYIGYTCCCWCPSIYFVWLTLHFWKVRGYHKMGNFLKLNNPQADNWNNPHHLLPSSTFF